MMKNRRRKSFALLILAAGLLVLIAVLGSFWKEAAIQTDFTRKNLAPCIQYPFGTDWMVRDMFVRTIAGLSLSIRIGLLTAAVSAAAAFLMGLCAAVCGKAADSIVQMLIDIVMGIPHMLLLRAGILGCCLGDRVHALGIARETHPRGGPAAKTEPVCEDRGEARKRKVLYRILPYGAEPDPAVYYGTCPPVSACDPS